ncbi:SCO family protein [Flavicella sediminum]|uniref:SCO family protein n=1 Tax=Flavicella sediminum TaxID=2585141 RepID=UPI00111E593B|nr:SCO family protein [Flavicella sediminum]
MKNSNILAILLFLALSVSCKTENKEKAPLKKEISTLPFFNTGDFTPEWISIDDKTYSDIHSIPDFSFINQDGLEVTQDTYKGKIYVADFFFTSCTGICRSLSLNMKILQEEFMDDPDVYLLSHSVTPSMDSVPVLKKYAKDYGVNSKKWNLVTGDKEVIYELARTAYFSDEDFVKTKEASEFIHTENFLLIDAKGRIRGVYNGTLQLEAKRLIRHIKLLKAEMAS